MDVFIGIDVGTQGTKAIAYRPASSTPSSGGDERGKILARASTGYSLLPADVPGRAEQDPDDWIEAVRSVLRKLVADLGLAAPSPSAPKHRYVLSGVGVSGQQHGMVLLDSEHRPLRPAKLWCDVEASRESDWIRDEAAPAIDGAGKWDHVVPSFTSPKVLWTIRNEPDVWNRVRWCVLPHDYVNLVLRGCHDVDDGYSRANEEMIPTTDRGDASGSGVFEPASNRYCMELVNAIDPSGRYAKSLPQILDPLDICGSMSLQWMKDIGLLEDADCYKLDASNIPYIAISAGSGDNMCSALGVGCVESGMAVLSLGTSGTIFGVSRSPPSSQVSPFADACGNFLPLVCVMSCTGVLNSVLDSFFNGCSSNKNGTGDDAKSQERKWTHDDATEMASCHPPGCHGITFLPYLTPGERTPDWPHASGAILGLTGSNIALAATNPKESMASRHDNENPPANPMSGLLYRAAMEGITYLLAEAVSTMKKACGDGFQPRCLLVVGGGSRNPLWRQMLADVLGMELRFPGEKESAALGAAFQAGAATDAARNKGAKTLSLEEYVLRQSIAMEDEVVRPTRDETTMQLYQAGREQYRKYSAKLFKDSKS